MPTERELAAARGVQAGNAGVDLNRSATVPLNIGVVQPPLAVQRALEFVQGDIRPVYERLLSLAKGARPSGNAVGPQAVAFFATRCLARVLGVPAHERASTRDTATDVRVIVAALLKKAVAVCAENPLDPDQQLAAEVRTFLVPIGLTRQYEKSALSEIIEAAKALADCLKSVYAGRDDQCQSGAVNVALHALNAVVLDCGISFESSEDAKSLHAEQLRDLEALTGIGSVTHFDLGETGPFGPLWKGPAPELLGFGQVAWQAEILVTLKPHMPATSTVLISAECSHVPTDVYAELRMPKGKGNATNEPELSSMARKRMMDNVVADLKALRVSCVGLQEQMAALIQERLDALSGKTFGSFAANKTVVDELNAIVEGYGIRLLYAGPKKVYRGRVVVVRVYDHPDAVAGQFFVRLTDARATKVSGGNEFPALRAVAGAVPEKQV